MAYNPQQQNGTSVPKEQPLCVDFSKLNAKSSMIYSLLPSAVQNRLPRLSSIGKSACTYAPVFEIEKEDRTFNKAGIVIPVDPGSEIVVREVQSNLESVEVASYFDPQPGYEENTRAQLNQQSIGSENAIDWKFANQGAFRLNLLSLSVQESATISQTPAYGNVAFARQLYLHGLTYLLRGLPRDLTPEEQLSIQSALPQTFQEFNTSDPLSTRSRPCTNSPSSPSVLHKLLASTIIQLFLLFQFLLPYLKFLLRSAYEYERTHHISEKVLASSVEVADAVGKQSLAMTAAFYGMGNGKVGEALTEAATWFIEGITGGIHEGVGEGLSIMGAKKAASSE